MSKKRIYAMTAGVIVAAGLGWWFVAVSWNHTGQRTHTDPLAPAVDAYNHGKYRDAEVAAQCIVDANSRSKDPARRRKAVEGRYVLAFSAARRKDMAQARDRFAVLKTEAAKLPDKGARPPMPGVVRPTLEAEGAYQHAVCTAALGDKKAAEAEYMKFIKDYPESPLTGQAVERIGWLHNKHVPATAEAAWAESTRIAQAREDARRKAREKAESLCGPECLAELLRRSGTPAKAEALASELKTTSQGTSLLALATVAKKHGLAAEGVSLTMKGLSKQPLPLIALVVPGHYVIVDKVTDDDVTIWDPSGNGTGKPSTRQYPADTWSRRWFGVAMVVSKG